MRYVDLAEGEYYHILGRGNNKQKIFFNKEDYIKMLFNILYFQSSETFTNTKRNLSYFKTGGDFKIDKKALEEIFKNRGVEVVNFCLMPNHYHLTLLNKNDDGISKYMQRILNSYAKYFNTKYERSGHLFQGPYKAVHIEDDRQLTYLSTYIHKNPKELKGVDYRKYPWSSYQDYVRENRWGKLLKTDIVLEGFDEKNTYESFVKDSLAKEVGI